MCMLDYIKVADELLPSLECVAEWRSVHTSLPVSFRAEGRKAVAIMLVFNSISVFSLSVSSLLVFATRE